MSDDPVATFRAHSDRRGGSVVVVAEGELDLTGAPRLIEAVPDGSEPLVLDLASVAFMDSSGLRALIEARQACADAGRRFALARPSEAVRRVLELVGLDREFDVIEAPPA